MKIYLGCSLTHANPEYISDIAKLKDKLRKNYFLFDFIGLIKGTDKEVYESDRNCVKTCDIIIAEASYPSTGLGYEIALGIEKGKIVLAFAHNDAKVSRMILGITKKNYNFERYSSFDDLYNKIILKLEKIKNKF